MQHSVSFTTACTYIKKLANGGLFHIFGANIVNKILGFATNILIVRFLSQEGYGVFSYAWSIYSTVVLFSGFGLISGMLQYASESRPEVEKRAYLKYGLTRGLLVDSAIAICMLLIGLVAPLPIADAGPCIACLAPLILLDYLYQYAQIVFRSRKDNQHYAFLTNVNSVFFAIFGTVGAAVGGVLGTIVGRYVAYITNALYSWWVFRKQKYTVFGAEAINKEEAKGLWKYSVSTGASSIINQLTYLVDVIVIGSIVGNPISVATYRVATMLPEGLLFIPTAVVIYVAPHFIEHNKDMVWFGKNVRRVFIALELLMLPVVLVLIVFSEPIIVMLWGTDYLSAVLPFRIMATGLLISPLRTICATLLAALREIKINLGISVITLISNSVLTYSLTYLYDITGAAVAVTSVTAITASLSALYLFHVIKVRLNENME